MKNYKLCIVGNNYQALLSAMVIGRHIPNLTNDIVVILTEQKNNGVISGLSDIKKFNELVGLNEKTFITTTGADVNLAFQINQDNNIQYFNDSEYGFSVNGVNFHQLVNKLNKGVKRSLHHYNLTAKLSELGKFSPASDKPNSIYSTVNYGYKVSELFYSKFLRALVESLNIDIFECPINGVKLSDNKISSIEILSDENTHVNADLFIDCTSDGALIQNLSPSTAIDQYIPSWTSNSTKNDKNFVRSNSTRLEISENKIEKFSTTAQAEFVQSLDFDPSKSPQQQAVIRKTPWKSNCIAIGEAFVKLPNILIDRLHIVSSQLIQIIDLLTNLNPPESTKSIFNSSCSRAVSHLIDIDNFFILQTAGSTNTTPTPSNKSRIDLYQSNGNLYLSDSGIIPDKQWPILLDIFGYSQSSSDLFSNQVSVSEAGNQLLKMRTLIEKAAQAAPPYSHWITQ